MKVWGPVPPWGRRPPPYPGLTALSTARDVRRKLPPTTCSPRIAALDRGDDLARLVHAVAFAAADERRPTPRRRPRRDRRARRDSSRRDAETRFGNVLRALERGGAEASGSATRALLSTLLARGVALSPLPEGAEAQARVAEKLLWLSTHTSIDALGAADAGARRGRGGPLDRGRRPGAQGGRGDGAARRPCGGRSSAPGGAPGEHVQRGARSGAGPRERGAGSHRPIAARRRRPRGGAWGRGRGAPHGRDRVTSAHPVVLVILGVTGILAALYVARLVARLALRYRRPAELPHHAAWRHPPLPHRAARPDAPGSGDGDPGGAAPAGDARGALPAPPPLRGPVRALDGELPGRAPLRGRRACRVPGAARHRRARARGPAWAWTSSWRAPGAAFAAAAASSSSRAAAGPRPGRGRPGRPRTPRSACCAADLPILGPPPGPPISQPSEEHRDALQGRPLRRAPASPARPLHRPRRGRQLPPASPAPHGYVDGYMRAMLESGQATKHELLELVARERARVSGPATRENRRRERVRNRRRLTPPKNEARRVSPPKGREGSECSRGSRPGAPLGA